MRWSWWLKCARLPRSTMLDERTVAASRTATGPGWLVWLVILIFVVYPLSFGPAFKLVFDWGVPREVLFIYEPIVMVSGYEPVGDFFVWYVYDFWSAG